MRTQSFVRHLSFTLHAALLVAAMLGTTPAPACAADSASTKSALEADPQGWEDILPPADLQGWYPHGASAYQRGLALA
ncbi:MAG: hypothetical protein NTW87_07100 [Planctomycetota bacterium]|nr:hypothetical protein [Planctomycetota bacterium]